MWGNSLCQRGFSNTSSFKEYNCLGGGKEDRSGLERRKCLLRNVYFVISKGQKGPLETILGGVQNLNLCWCSLRFSLGTLLIAGDLSWLEQAAHGCLGLSFLQRGSVNSSSVPQTTSCTFNPSHLTNTAHRHGGHREKTCLVVWPKEKQAEIVRFCHINVFVNATNETVVPRQNNVMKTVHTSGCYKRADHWWSLLCDPI